MTGNISYDYIWQIYQTEKSTNAIQLVPKSFYADAQAFVAELSNKTDDESVAIKTNKRQKSRCSCGVGCFD